jgi:hypothetical protein
MNAEFIHDKANLFISENLIKIDNGDWHSFESISENQLNIIYIVLADNRKTANYIKYLMTKNIRQKRDLVLLTLKRYFSAAKPEPDITDDGKVNIENE